MANPAGESLSLHLMHRQRAYRPARRLPYVQGRNRVWAVETTIATSYWQCRPNTLNVPSSWTCDFTPLLRAEGMELALGSPAEKFSTFVIRF
jgi:hypothetical protein